MLYRKSSSLVQALQVDGSEQVYRAILCMRGASQRQDGVEVRTQFGRWVLHKGDWLTRNEATGAIQVHDDTNFNARHEAVLQR